MLNEKEIKVAAMKLAVEIIPVGESDVSIVITNAKKIEQYLHSDSSGENGFDGKTGETTLGSLKEVKEALIVFANTIQYAKDVESGKLIKKNYTLQITPAIIPAERHKIEKILSKIGYNVLGGGTHTDMSACDISFSK